MKIDTSNYYEYANIIGVGNFSPAMSNGHNLIEKVTNAGSDWEKYFSNPNFKKPIDTQFAILEAFLKKKSKPEEKPKVETEKKDPVKPKFKPKDRLTKKAAPKVKKESETVISPAGAAKPVESLTPEIIFIRRFANLNGKVKPKNIIRSFLAQLQKAILERKIRKTSLYAKHINHIQKELLKYVDRKGENISIDIDDKTMNDFLRIAGKEVQMTSINFIKSYVGMQGKEIPKEKAKNLYNRIVNALEKNKLSESDPYFDKIEFVLDSLKDYVGKEKKVLKIQQAELNGLMGVLGCDCNKSLDGFDDEDEEPISASNKNIIVNSEDLLKMEFDRLGFKDKWLEFIGDPSPGFTAMIFGLPKFGKSYLAVEFAGYLARNHGTVLYVAKEEGIDETLRIKLKDKNVAHPDLYVSDFLPDDLSKYDFVFLDSVTSLKLSPEKLEQLKNKYPDTSFVFLLQATKKGQFRGSNEYAHNVDVIIDVYDEGKASQNGRFNQGGEMNIFE